MAMLSHEPEVKSLTPASALDPCPPETEAHWLRGSCFGALPGENKWTDPGEQDMFLKMQAEVTKQVTSIVNVPPITDI